MAVLTSVTIGWGCRGMRSREAWVTRDSSGVEVVENSSVAGGSHVVRTTATSAPLPGSTELGLVKGARLLSRGRIAIADGGLRQLVLTDTSNAQPRLIGRQGEGPGEFGRIGHLFRCADDTLVIAESNRLNVFVADGRFAREVKVVPVPWDVIGVSSDCSALVVVRQELKSRPGPTPTYPLTVLRYNLADRSTSRIASAPGIQAAGIRSPWAIGRRSIDLCRHHDSRPSRGHLARSQTRRR